MPTSSGTPDSIVLSGEQLSQLEAQYPGLGETIRGFKQKTSDVQTPATTTGPVNEYTGIATEHAEFIKTHNSLEIAGWLGDKLNIASWKAGAFHGERKVLSTPTGEEMARLQEFTKALGKSWTGANGGSDNHSQFFLMDGYIQNALFGQANMAQVDARLDTFHTDWQRMGKDFDAKAKYLLEKVGLDIKDPATGQTNWSKLTGIRSGRGGFFSSDGLYASGALDGDDVLRMGVDRGGSDVYLYSASNARLCFLA